MCCYHHIEFLCVKIYKFNMSKIMGIFINIERLTNVDGQQEFISSLLRLSKTNEDDQQNNIFNSLRTFLGKIVAEIDALSNELKIDETILISVKNQKLLRTCYQLITSLGISQCLIPGLGIHLSKRCMSSHVLPSFNFSDKQKYEMLTEFTDFYTRSYNIPVLKKIILTLHLSDYLAALIQLAFAPFKRPGTYNNFVMTPELYESLTQDRKKYISTYEYLVTNCFQPTLMKELLVLQSVTEPSPPAFVKRVIAKEMSRRLLAASGLLSLIRCFMESYDIDTGFDWKKIDMICKIVASKHGDESDESYLNNICAQLTQILTLNNTNFLTTAIACTLAINEKYPQAKPVTQLMTENFQTFDQDHLRLELKLPGTIILAPQEVEHKINVLSACVCTTKIYLPISLLLQNAYVLFLLGLKCRKNEELKLKIKEILLRTFEQMEKKEITMLLTQCLFGKEGLNLLNLIEEYDAGLAIKYSKEEIAYPKEEALFYFLSLVKSSININFIQNIFEILLNMLTDLSTIRIKNANDKSLINVEDEPVLLDETDEQYIYILQLLSELTTLPKIVSSIKANPSGVLDFVEHFILSNQNHENDECTTMALVLLNTILANSDRNKDLERRFIKLIPLLKTMSNDESSMNYLLCKEALSLITSERSKQEETRFTKAVADIFDNLLPVRAHGIIELTKLIDSKDPETISKKHYIFCIFQEHLKDSDSYMYLSAINGIASLGTYCPDEVLHVLCKEFLQLQIGTNHESKYDQNKIAELRMKIGDIVVKVTKRLGEMAIVHKTLLLNTMLCGCRDEDPLIRTSALSNLAEISLVLHYKMGTIIYEVLLCVWAILQSDKAIECRRAAIMVISSLIKGLGKDTLVELKENLLPIYRTLKDIYNDNNEDSVLRVHAQIGLEELNDIVNQFLFPKVNMENKIFVLDEPNDIKYK